MRAQAPGGYTINAGRCVNFEGFYDEASGNASSPDSNGYGVRWGNLKGPQTARHLARVKVLLGRGMRAFYLDSHISPGRVTQKSSETKRGGSSPSLVPSTRQRIYTYWEPTCGCIVRADA